MPAARLPTQLLVVLALVVPALAACGQDHRPGADADPGQVDAQTYAIGTRYVDLPRRARGLLLEATDEWLVCAHGPTVAGSVKVPCSRPHDWRAISTIVVGDSSTTYPGDRLVQVRSRDYCSASVGALLGYPVDYDFGYTWFHEAEWQAGNRRSVCWARTDA